MPNLLLLGNLMLMWKKDDQIFLLQNKILSPNKRLTVEYDENGNTVSIKEARKGDAGIYACQVKHLNKISGMPSMSRVLKGQIGLFTSLIILTQFFKYMMC